MTIRSKTGDASLPKLLVYLLLLAAVLILDAGFRKLAIHPPPQRLAPSGAATIDYEIVRVGKPIDELRGDLQILGIPNFLRNAKISAEVDAHDPSAIIFVLRHNDKLIGRYIEKLIRIDDDRTKIMIAFEPADKNEVAAIAAPINSDWTPPELFRVVMREHVRSGTALEGFNLDILRKSGSLAQNFLAADRGSEPQTDDFPLIDEGRAAIRNAYRDEAARAGADVDKL